MRVGKRERAKLVQEKKERLAVSARAYQADLLPTWDYQTAHYLGISHSGKSRAQWGFSRGVRSSKGRKVI